MLRPLSALILLASCTGGPKPRPGDVDVVWRGEERGRFIGPLTATHCAESGLVEMLAVRGDTGLGVALFLRDSTRVEAADYLVVPGSQLEEPRPGATAGIRWFATTSVAAFEGVTGAVHLEVNDDQLKGTMNIKFQGLDRPDTLRLLGSFDFVHLARADSGCGLISRRNRM